MPQAHAFCALNGLRYWAWLAGLGEDGRTNGGMDRRTTGRTDGQNFSPFYRTLSPTGAAAQKSEREREREREKEREKGRERKKESDLY